MTTATTTDLTPEERTILTAIVHQALADATWMDGGIQFETPRWFMLKAILEKLK